MLDFDRALSIYSYKDKDIQIERADFFIFPATAAIKGKQHFYDEENQSFSIEIFPLFARVIAGLVAIILSPIILVACLFKLDNTKNNRMHQLFLNRQILPRIERTIPLVEQVVQRNLVEQKTNVPEIPQPPVVLESQVVNSVSAAPIVIERPNIPNVPLELPVISRQNRVRSVQPLSNSSSPAVSDTAQKCTICFENMDPAELEDSQTIRTLPCKHKFHEVCISRWDTQTKGCPLCRNGIVRSRTDSGLNGPPSIRGERRRAQREYRRHRARIGGSMPSMRALYFQSVQLQAHSSLTPNFPPPSIFNRSHGLLRSEVGLRVGNRTLMMAPTSSRDDSEVFSV